MFLFLGEYLRLWIKLKAARYLLMSLLRNSYPPVRLYPKLLHNFNAQHKTGLPEAFHLLHN